MPDINGIPYVDSTDLVSGWPATSQSVAQEVSDQLASKVDYPSGGSDGQPLVKSGTGIAWGNLDGELIATASPSGVVNFSVQSCFSSAYTMYRIYVAVNSSAGASTTLNLRMLNGSTPYTLTNYGYQQNLFTTSLAATQVGAQTSVFLAAATNSDRTFVIVDVLQPFETEVTSLFSTAMEYNAGTIRQAININTVATLSSYDGFQILTGNGSSTITGTAAVYGFRNS